MIGAFDVTQCHHTVGLTSDQKKLLLDAGRQAHPDVPAAEQLVTREQTTGVLVPTDQRDSNPLTSYEIPLTAGKHAQLRIARPVDTSDLDRLKRWIDLFSDVLTEDDSNESAQQKSWLREKVQAGVEQINRGETVAGEAAFDRILKRNSSARQ